MELIDLMALCSDGTVITVYDTDDKFVTEYNGKDSIDEKYNRCRVLGIGGGYGRDNAIDVIVEVSDALF